MVRACVRYTVIPVREGILIKGKADSLIAHIACKGVLEGLRWEHHVRNLHMFFIYCKFTVNNSSAALERRYQHAFHTFFGPLKTSDS